MLCCRDEGALWQEGIRRATHLFRRVPLFRSQGRRRHLVQVVLLTPYLGVPLVFPLSFQSCCLPLSCVVVLVSHGYLSVVSSSWSRFSCRPPSPVISQCSPPSLFVGKDTGRISTHRTRGYRFLPRCLPEYHGICIPYTAPPRHRHDPSCLAPYPARYTLNSPYVPDVEQLLSAMQEGLSCRVQRHVGGNALGGMVGCLQR